MTTYDNVKFSDGSNTVYVAVIKVAENYTNMVKVITLPTTEGTPDDPMLINLNRIEDRFTITGHLNYGKLNAADTWTTARDKKEGLKSIISQGTIVTMTYEGVDYGVAVDKYEITAVGQDNTDDTDAEIVYNVTISCVVGTDIV